MFLQIVILLNALLSLSINESYAKKSGISGEMFPGIEDTFIGIDIARNAPRSNVFATPKSKKDVVYKYVYGAKYAVPKSMIVNPNTVGTSDSVCDEYSSYSDLISSKVKSYQLDISTTITGEYGPVTATVKSGFQRDSTYNDFSETTKYSNKNFAEVIIELIYYSFTINLSTRELDNDFLKSISNLPLEYDQNQYFAFINLYGTHTRIGGDVGGLIRNTMAFSSSTTMFNQEHSSKVKECLSLEFELSVRSIDVTVETDTKITECQTLATQLVSNTKFTAASEEKYAKAFGGDNTKIYDFKAWTTSVMDISNPRQSLDNMAVLATQNLRFSLLTDLLWYENIRRKKSKKALIPSSVITNLNTAITNYLSQFEPTPSPTPPPTVDYYLDVKMDPIRYYGQAYPNSASWDVSVGINEQYPLIGWKCNPNDNSGRSHGSDDPVLVNWWCFNRDMYYGYSGNLCNLGGADYYIYISGPGMYQCNPGYAVAGMKCWDVCDNNNIILICRPVVGCSAIGNAKLAGYSNTNLVSSSDCEADDKCNKKNYCEPLVEDRYHNSITIAVGWKCMDDDCDAQQLICQTFQAIV